MSDNYSLPGALRNVYAGFRANLHVSGGGGYHQFLSSYHFHLVVSRGIISFLEWLFRHRPPKGQGYWKSLSLLASRDFCSDNVHNQESRLRYSIFINDELLWADLMNAEKPPPVFLSFSFASFYLFHGWDNKQKFKKPTYSRGRWKVIKEMVPAQLHSTEYYQFKTTPAPWKREFVKYQSKESQE